MAVRETAFSGANAMKHVEHLAVAIGPRLTGSPGEHAAAAYVERTLKSFGLKASRRRFGVTTYDNRMCSFAVRRGGEWRTIQAEPVLLSKSTPRRGVEGEVFFAHTGQAEYLTPEMKGRVVLVCGLIRPEDRPRVLRYGPRAIVMIDPALREDLRRTLLPEEVRKLYGSLPMATIRHLDGVEIIKAGADRARLVLHNRESKSHSFNVLGELAGTENADEIVVICAHYDSHWRIPGAADNAGGTAVMLELARVLAARPSRRTLRFIAFGSEETGLSGSRYYAETLARTARRQAKARGFDDRTDKTDRDRHRLTFNIDVHGCVLGQFTATWNGPEDVGASVRLLAREMGMACEVKKMPMSSDGTSLAAVGVPNVQFARYGGTTGFGHQVGDDIRYISAEALAAAGAFAERYLRRYVTDAPVLAFDREIPDDQMKEIKEYFAKGKLPLPGEPPAARRAARATARGCSGSGRR